MGNCKYCGQSAGLFKDKHEACANDLYDGLNAVIEPCIVAALKGEALDGLPRRIQETFSTALPSLPLDSLRINSFLIGGWIRAVNVAMKDGRLSEQEFQGLNLYRRYFNLKEAELDEEGQFSYFERAALLKFLAHDRIVPRFDHKRARSKHGRIPFNLMRSEELLWLVTQVPYGLGKKPDTGFLGLTTRHLYFTGSINSFRIQLERIVSLKQYSDGIGINRDTSPSYQEIFRMSQQDSWLIANLVDELMGMDEVRLPKRDSPTLDELMNQSYESNDDADTCEST